MAMQTVYDADGKAHVVEPVDAREYVNSGTYFREPPEPAAEITVTVAGEDVAKVVADEAEKAVTAKKAK